MFLERDGGAAAVIEANLRAARLGGVAAEVVRADAIGWLRDRPASGEPFDVVVIDPPYADTAALARTLELLGDVSAPLVVGGRVVAKHFWRDRPPDRIGMLSGERDRRFGETALTFYRREEAPTE